MKQSTEAAEKRTIRQALIESSKADKEMPTFIIDREYKYKNGILKCKKVK